MHDDIEVLDSKYKKSKKWPKKTFIIFLTLDIMACIGLFLTYGPISYFRDLLVTTAMSTKSHHYLARIFYTDQMIEKVLNSNYIKESGESTNTDDIIFDNTEPNTYESYYEEQILKRDKGNNLYKIIPVSGNGYKGSLVAIYDATKVELVLSDYFGSRGEFISNIAVNNKAKIAINASGFTDPKGAGSGGAPTGQVILDGKLIWTGRPNYWGGGLVGFTKDNKLMLTKETATEAIKKGMEDAVEFGPFLIVNGVASIMQGNGGFGIQPRTIIAQRKDGIVLFLVIDGRQVGHSIGIDLKEATKILLRYKAHNASNLDGGASSVLAVEQKLYNKPCAYSVTGERWSPNAWIVKE